MKYNVKKIKNEYDFYIDGVSYAGSPRNNTMMYISKKVEYLVDNLTSRQECLVFVENGIEVSDELKRKNCFVFSDNPQYSYIQLAMKFADEQKKQEMEWGYTMTEGGYYIGHNVSIGDNAYIEPNVLIGHNVSIGDNAMIMAGSIIKYATIGNNFLCNENAVIGNAGFTMAENEMGDKYRIPALGRVIIGDDVEIGSCNDIARGACGDTILENYVKLDGLVHIGHEAHLHENVEITAGAIVAGFAVLEQHAYLGINASIRNRICLAENCVIGMGANVTKSVEAGITVAGNPAHPYRR